MKLITTAEAAKRLGVSQNMVQKWIKSGTLPATKVTSRMWLVDPRDLERMKERDTKPGPKKKED